MGLVWFLCLMAYQTSWVIQCQNHPRRRIVVILFNPLLGLGDKGNSYLSQGINPKLNVIAWLKFGLAYFKAAIQLWSHYTIVTLLVLLSVIYYQITTVLKIHSQKYKYVAINCWKNIKICSNQYKYVAINCWKYFPTQNST